MIIRLLSKQVGEFPLPYDLYVNERTIGKQLKIDDWDKEMYLDWIGFSYKIKYDDIHNKTEVSNIFTLQGKPLQKSTLYFVH